MTEATQENLTLYTLKCSVRLLRCRASMPTLTGKPLKQGQGKSSFMTLGFLLQFIFELHVGSLELLDRVKSV